MEKKKAHNFFRCSDRNTHCAGDLGNPASTPWGKKEVVSVFINQRYTKMMYVTNIPATKPEHLSQYVVYFEALPAAPGGLNKS